MNAFSSWIQQHILRGGWAVDLSQTPPSLGQLGAYESRARWRRGLLVVALLCLMGLGLWGFHTLFDAAVDAGWLFDDKGLGAGLFLVLGSFAIIGPSLWAIFQLTENLEFDIVGPTHHAFLGWEEALQVLPELARYQQWLFANRNQWPVRAEVEAAKQRAGEALIEQELSKISRPTCPESRIPQ